MDNIALWKSGVERFVLRLSGRAKLYIVTLKLFLIPESWERQDINRAVMFFSTCTTAQVLI